MCIRDRARHGPDYEMANIFKNVALKKILVGKTRVNSELWEAVCLSFDELLKKVKEHARAKKLDKDAAKGKTGVALGAANASQEEWGWQSWSEEDGWGEVNAVTPGKGDGPNNLKGKSKGKGKYGDGRGGKAKGKGRGKGPLTGCFICGGKHFARECPKHPQLGTMTRKR